jgi:hypothetical protein
VSAGKIIKIAGVRYQEPVPAGNGSCASGSTHGLALATWNDGTKTVISYQTQSITGGVFLGGSQNNAFAAVVPSMKVKRVGAPAPRRSRRRGTRGLGASAR